MSITPLSSSTAPQPWQQIRNDFQSLSQALQTGNLQVAQKAYASIQQDQKNGPQPPANSPAAQAFTALGQALQSGDLAGAQQAFSSLQTDMQAMRQARGSQGHHGHGKGGGGGGSDDAGGSSSSDNSTKTVSNVVTTVNANGTLSVTTTYTDGSVSTDTKPNPTPAVSQSPLSPDSAQLAALLDVQEQVQAGG